MLLFLSMFILHLLNLSDFEAQPGKDSINDDVKEEQISELVEFIEWSEFVTQYLLVGNVRTLVFDPDGVVKIVHCAEETRGISEAGTLQTLDENGKRIKKIF